MAEILQNGPINIQDVGLEAPDLPGLYVWYSKLVVGRADWHSEFAEGEEKARASFMKVLNSHSNKFAQQEMNVKATANFSIAWNGNLKEYSASRWGGDSLKSPALAPTINSNSTRELLIEVLNKSFPFFYSPLYVGLTTDQTLRKRLKQHSDDFLGLWDVSQKDETLKDRVENKNFAERALSLGFGPEDLFCFTLGFERKDGSELDAAEINSLIEASEWLFNRWATPTLGRR